MRIAVSGTHGCGKSTLIDRFLMAHPDFAHEPEPYTVLQEDYGELFAAAPSADDFYRQLEFNIDRLHHYGANEKVIYERCPADFLAYLLALSDLHRDQGASLLVESSLDMVEEGLKLLDLIVFLPLDGMDSNGRAALEDQELRIAVDDRLIGMLRDDDFNLFTARCPVIQEVRGDTAQRLLTIESVLESGLGEGGDD